MLLIVAYIINAAQAYIHINMPRVVLDHWCEGAYTKNVTTQHNRNQAREICMWQHTHYTHHISIPSTIA